MQRRRIMVEDFIIDSVGFGLDEFMGSLWGVYGEFMGSLCRECINAGGTPFRNRPDSQSGVR